MFEQILGLQDHQIRLVGLFSMVAGVVLLWLVQGG